MTSNNPQLISTQYLKSTNCTSQTPRHETGTVPPPTAKRLPTLNQLHRPNPIQLPERHCAFFFRNSFPPYGTLLARTFAASLAALGSAKCVSGFQLRWALTENQTPAQPRRQPQPKAENFRPPPPARLRLCGEEKLNSDWLLPVFIFGGSSPRPPTTR